jgi:hypothetical protein
MRPEDKQVQDFDSIDDLKQRFLKSKNYNFAEEIDVNGLPYKRTQASNYDMRDLIDKGIKQIVAYGTFKRKEAVDAGMNQFIVFLWGWANNMLVPHDVRFMSAARMGMPITEGTAEKMNVDKQKILGTVTEIQISNIPGCPPIKAKVDTGADISSIHADDWSSNNGQVTFTSPDISPNRITLPVIEKQAIKSSNGDIEYRPVVELDVRVNGVPMSGVMFNLNDRGTMEYSILVGKNILERGGFLIDPKIAEEDFDVDIDTFEIDWEMLAEEFADEEVEAPSLEISEADVIEYIKNNT